jgi:hypothetical protein
VPISTFLCAVCNVEPFNVNTQEYAILFHLIQVEQQVLRCLSHDESSHAGVADRPPADRTSRRSRGHFCAGLFYSVTRTLRPAQIQRAIRHGVPQGVERAVSSSTSAAIACLTPAHVTCDR